MRSGTHDVDAALRCSMTAKTYSRAPGQGADLEEVAFRQRVRLVAQEVGPNGVRAFRAGAMPWSFRTSQTVEAATLMPSAASSPWMRRWPHPVLSRAGRSTRARMDRTVRGRPRRLGAQVAA
jgi:hypothetical protein